MVRVRRLSGGSSSAVHAVDVRTANGRVLHLVLRRHLLLSWLQEEPDLAEREARNLELLHAVGIPAPQLVAVDSEGAECDVPAVLMTRMPGHLDLHPRDLDLWLRRMAELLPPVHAVDPGQFHVQKWAIWDDLREAQPPEWSRRKPEWERLIDIVRGPWPAYRTRFVHRDFQQYNVLWSRGRPNCLVDWINASMGPAELDYGHFRHNLLDFGFDVVDRFEKVYREVTGEEPDPFWEALNFSPSWCDTAQKQAAVDAYVASLVAKLR